MECALEASVFVVVDVVSLDVVAGDGMDSLAARVGAAMCLSMDLLVLSYAINQTVLAVVDIFRWIILLWTRSKEGRGCVQMEHAQDVAK